MARPRLEFAEEPDGNGGVRFSSVAGEDHWIEHESVRESSRETDRPSLKSTAGRGVFFKQRDRLASNTQFTFKVVLLGDPSVGKTCIANLYIHHKVYYHTQSTIAFDCLTKELIIEGVPSTLQLWDTAGMEQFRRGLINQYYRNLHGVIFVYDITKRETFVNIEEWLQEMRQYSRSDGERVQKVLIGNKSDLEVDRKVTREEGQEYADCHGMIFVEMSAHSQESMDLLEEIMGNLSGLMLASRMENSFSRSMGGVVRLEAPPDDDWVVVDESPQGPFSSRDNRRGFGREELTESVRRVLSKPRESLQRTRFTRTRTRSANSRCC